MQVVGDHLRDHAYQILGKSQHDADFARSAFNRYYYAAYLVSRQLLIDTVGTKVVQHKALPDILTGTFRKKMKRKIQNGFQSGLLNGGQRSQLLSRLNDHTSLLSQLLRDAYGVRVLADYEPEIEITVQKATIHLGSSTLPAASGWGKRATTHCVNLHRVWKDLGN